jgi:hypothetical protein
VGTTPALGIKNAKISTLDAVWYIAFHDLSI